MAENIYKVGNTTFRLRRHVKDECAPISRSLEIMHLKYGWTLDTPPSTAWAHCLRARRTVSSLLRYTLPAST